MFAFLCVLFLTIPASAEITIIEPADDSPVISSDFEVVAYINDTNVKYAQVRIVDYPWISMEQSTQTDWSIKLKIADYSEGEHTLTAKYLKSGEVVWNYVTQTIKITIQKPAIQKGFVEFTIKDKNNNPVSDVILNPSGNKSDTNGIVKAGDQPLNTAINFSLSKEGYITAYQLLTFTNNTLIQKSITLKKVGEDKRQFRVSGYNSMIEAPGMFYIKVKDDETGEAVDGADVMLYQGNIVKAIAGETVNGGRLTVSFNNAGYYEMVISKEGYEEWSDDITVISLKPEETPTPKPTPAPAPTPVPTISKKIRADVCEKLNSCEPLTDDEYRELLVVLEKKKVNETQTITAPTPPQNKESFPWAYLLGTVFVIGVVGFKYKNKILPSNQNKNKLPDSEEVMDTIPSLPTYGYETKIIKCDECDWKEKVDKDLSDEVAEERIKIHKEKWHKNT